MLKYHNTQEDGGFLIADLGGDTLEYSAYKVLSNNPTRVSEIAFPKCKHQSFRN